MKGLLCPQKAQATRLIRGRRPCLEKLFRRRLAGGNGKPIVEGVWRIRDGLTQGAQVGSAWTGRDRAARSRIRMSGSGCTPKPNLCARGPLFVATTQRGVRGPDSEPGRNASPSGKPRWSTTSAGFFFWNFRGTLGTFNHGRPLRTQIAQQPSAPPPWAGAAAVPLGHYWLVCCGLGDGCGVLLGTIFGIRPRAGGGVGAIRAWGKDAGAKIEGAARPPRVFPGRGGRIRHKQTPGWPLRGGLRRFLERKADGFVPPFARTAAARAAKNHRVVGRAEGGDPPRNSAGNVLVLPPQPKGSDWFPRAYGNSKAGFGQGMGPASLANSIRGPGALANRLESTGFSTGRVIFAGFLFNRISAPPFKAPGRGDLSPVSRGNKK